MSAEKPLTPLPQAGHKARWMVRKQIFRSLGYSLWQLVRFPLFLFSRHGFRKRIQALVHRRQG